MFKNTLLGSPINNWLLVLQPLTPVLRYISRQIDVAGFFPVFGLVIYKPIVKFTTKNTTDSRGHGSDFLLTCCRSGRYNHPT